MTAQMYHTEIKNLKLLKEVSFIIFVYSDGKNLKRNFYKNAAYFFKNFHGIQEPNQKSVTKSTGILTSGFFTRSGRRRFPSNMSTDEDN